MQSQDRDSGFEELLAVVATDTLIRLHVAEFDRRKAIGRSRLCAARPDLCRVALRLWPPSCSLRCARRTGCAGSSAIGMPRFIPAVSIASTAGPGSAVLCGLLTLGKSRAGKGECRLERADLVAHGEGLPAVLLPEAADETCGYRLRRLREAFGDRAYLALTLRRRPDDQLRLRDLSNLSAAMRVPTVVTNDVLFHEPDRRMLQDVVTESLKP